MQSDGSNVTVNKGIDLREISASNIESVEVISGVPSARYGNITSGAIIINKKAGYTPYNFVFNSNPNSYQTGANKGFKLKKGGFLNVDADYTYSNSKATSRKRYYQRINAGIRWTKMISESLEWNNNLSLRYGLGFDGQRDDPDEIMLIGEFENMDNSFSFSTNGSLKVLGRLNYSFSSNYRSQYAYKKLLEGGPSPIIESVEAGTVITAFTPVSFYQKSEFFGAPLNMNGRLEASQLFETLGFRHSTSTGFEFSFDKNYGRGRVLDEENNAATALAGAREMTFYNVPASEIYSLYFQDDISISSKHADYLLKLGLRYDNMLRRFNLLSPRVSFSGKYFEKFRLRLAYGVSYRTPSMLQLFPGPTYFDVINLNHYSSDEIHSLAVVTTYIYQPSFENLRPSKGSTLEYGFDFEHNGFNFRTTVFHKSIQDGISSVSKLMTFDRQIWEVQDIQPGIPPVVAPVDSIIRVSTTFNDFENAVTSKTTGFEISSEFPKIKATNTRINFTGGFLTTNEKTEKPYLRSSATLTGASASRYGVYERATYNITSSRSNLTIIQQIPQIRMMITMMAEATWLTKRSVAGYPSPYPLAFYSIDGTYNEIAEEERSSDIYSDLYYSREFLETTPTPAYFNFHLQVRKETKQGHSFSFYANNFLWYNPTYIDSRNNAIVELNSKVTFGIGFNLNL